MACRTLELTLVSARDLRSVNLVSKMEVYAVAYLAGDPRARQRVPTDRAPHGRDPTWNHTVRITVPASGPRCGTVRVLLRAERALGGDRDVGEVLLPLPDVLDGAAGGRAHVRPRASRPQDRLFMTQAPGRSERLLQARRGHLPGPRRPGRESPATGVGGG
ncbi:unnamed protein product [Urochloa humidicola]